MAPPLPIIITDTAEQRAFVFSDEVRVLRGSLWSGDYAIVAPDVPEYVTRRRQPTKREEAARPEFPALYASDVDPREHVAQIESADGVRRLLVLPHRVERKSLDDLAGCCTHERERFEAELGRLASLGPGRAVVVVEAGIGDVAAHSYKSKLRPRALVASTIAWQQRYAVGFLWADGRARAAQVAEMWLLRALKDHLAERKATA